MISACLAVSSSFSVAGRFLPWSEANAAAWEAGEPLTELHFDGDATIQPIDPTDKDRFEEVMRRQKDSIDFV